MLRKLRRGHFRPKNVHKPEAVFHDIPSSLPVMRPERLERGGPPADWTVETEVNGHLKSTNERWSFLGRFVGFVVLVQEIFVLPWLPQSAQFEIFFSSPNTILIHLYPPPSKFGSKQFKMAPNRGKK
jgi:hypothetical protein